jgi:hypothetical protein
VMPNAATYDIPHFDHSARQSGAGEIDRRRDRAAAGAARSGKTLIRDWPWTRRRSVTKPSTAAGNNTVERRTFAPLSL